MNKLFIKSAKNNHKIKRGPKQKFINKKTKGYQQNKKVFPLLINKTKSLNSFKYIYLKRFNVLEP